MLNRKEKEAIRTVEYEWKHYKIILIILIAVLTTESYLTGYLPLFLDGLGKYGYAGGFVSGFLYTFGITTPIALASFFVLAKDLNIWILTILGSIGGLLSEYFIYDFAKKEARKTIKIYENKKIKLPEVRSGFLKKLSPLIAGFILASPIPDEFAAVLFGVEQYRLRDFLIITFVFKFIGILFIVGLGRIF